MVLGGGQNYMKPKELMKVLQEDGWVVVRIQGSHYIHKHPTKPGAIPVALRNKDIEPGT